ncbi:MAG: glycosyltransferase [Myxococcales bacterium]|nr:glycosyltransferase [Myxococcales bacterium]
MAAEVLYVTFDGVLQPLPFSQVVRVVAGLARRGLRYHLLSLERPADLERADLRAMVGEVLGPAGVGWTPLRGGALGSPRRAAIALGRVAAQALVIARREGVRLVHARGYHGAVLAHALARTAGLPYLFDARGYWVEERSGPGGWFSRPAAYAAGKLLEQELFRRARAVVTLTELQALDVASGLFGPPPALLRVIPTCADYAAFYLRSSRPGQPGPADASEPGARREAVPAEVQRTLSGKRVLGIVGALNDTYLVEQTLALARRAIELHPAAHLLVLSAQRSEYERALEAAGIPPERRTLASAPHGAMPEWLQWMDWGMLLVPESAANRAKMPTKLAEFFATGVRPLFFGCNSDAARWVERAGSGHVLRDVDDAGLRSAARVAVEAGVDLERLRDARAITAPHFDLAAGLGAYEELVGRCLAPAQGRAR